MSEVSEISRATSAMRRSVARTRCFQLGGSRNNADQSRCGGTLLDPSVSGAERKRHKERRNAIVEDRADQRLTSARGDDERAGEFAVERLVSTGRDAYADSRCEFSSVDGAQFRFGLDQERVFGRVLPEEVVNAGADLMVVPPGLVAQFSRTRESSRQYSRAASVAPLAMA